MLRKIILPIVLLIAISPLFLFASGHFRQGGESGEFWRSGNVVTIYWNSLFFPSNRVNIYLWDKLETKLKVLSLGVKNEGIYSWLIPDSLSEGYYKIKITDGIHSKRSIISDNFFKIYKNVIEQEANNPIAKNSISYLYPNPARSTTRLNLQQEWQAEIIAVDMLGRAFPLWSGLIAAGDMELDVSTLPTGSYTLLIDYGTKREAIRLIKE